MVNFNILIGPCIHYAIVNTLVYHLHHVSSLILSHFLPFFSCQVNSGQSLTFCLSFSLSFLRLSISHIGSQIRHCGLCSLSFLSHCLHVIEGDCCRLAMPSSISTRLSRSIVQSYFGSTLAGSLSSAFRLVCHSFLSCFHYLFFL